MLALDSFSIPGCCARAVIGHVDMPPRNMMNSRRLIASSKAQDKAWLRLKSADWKWLTITASVGGALLGTSSFECGGFALTFVCEWDQLRRRQHSDRRCPVGVGEDAPRGKS